MAQPQYLQLANNPEYIRRAERARAGQSPSRASPLGAIAAVRCPGTENRSEMMQEILAQDGDLVVGSLEPACYKPATVCGIELKLEPLQPSIGTVVHGLDLAADLGESGESEMVAFLRAFGCNGGCWSFAARGT